MFWDEQGFSIVTEEAGRRHARAVDPLSRIHELANRMLVNHDLDLGKRAGQMPASTSMVEMNWVRKTSSGETARSSSRLNSRIVSRVLSADVAVPDSIIARAVPRRR
jgi:hypothetical protein